MSNSVAYIYSMNGRTFVGTAESVSSGQMPSGQSALPFIECMSISCRSAHAPPAYSYFKCFKFNDGQPGTIGFDKNLTNH